jgi:hypothetical protein
MLVPNTLKILSLLSLTKTEKLRALDSFYKNSEIVLKHSNTVRSGLPVKLDKFTIFMMKIETLDIDSAL